MTAAQILQDVRAQLDRHASPDVVEWHFAGIHRPWVKRALAAAGFGRISSTADDVQKPVFSIAKVDQASDHLEKEAIKGSPKIARRDVEDFSPNSGGDGDGGELNRAVGKFPVLSLDRGAFHLDIPAAVASVMSRHGQQGLGHGHGRGTPLSGVVGHGGDYKGSEHDSRSLDD